MNKSKERKVKKEKNSDVVWNVFHPWRHADNSLDKSVATLQRKRDYRTKFRFQPTS